MDPVTSFLRSVKLARKQSYRNLTIFPILAPDGTKPDYLTLEQALSRNLVRITEMDKAGSVPELRLLNKGKKNILIVEGEELVGAKQNRIVNATFLIAGKTEVVIPVSCVEQGRWQHESDAFSSGNKMMHASLRRNHQMDVKFSLKEGRGYRSDQGRIWNDISGKLDRMNVSAPTDAMADAYDSYEDKISDFLKAFRLIEWQVGAIFAINSQVLGLECFGCSDTFSRFFNKLVKSYALDALDNLDPQKNDTVAPEKARRFLHSIVKSEKERHPSISLGETVMFGSRSISGVALVEENRVLHLSAFKKAHGHGQNRVRYQRFSHRRGQRVY